MKSMDEFYLVLDLLLLKEISFSEFFKVNQFEIYVDFQNLEVGNVNGIEEMMIGKGLVFFMRGIGYLIDGSCNKVVKIFIRRLLFEGVECFVVDVQMLDVMGDVIGYFKVLEMFVVFIQ